MGVSHADFFRILPKAMAESFRSGKLGILDYYKLRNVQADTEMRNSIATAGENRAPGS